MALFAELSLGLPPAHKNGQDIVPAVLNLNKSVSGAQYLADTGAGGVPNL